MSIEPVSTSQKKILVIDDNEIILKTTSMKLQNGGYQVFTTLDASEGIALGRKIKPDLILLDIGFPPAVGMNWDGFSIMDWLHRVDENDATQIAALFSFLRELQRKFQLAVMLVHRYLEKR